MKYNNDKNIEYIKANVPRDRLEQYTNQIRAEVIDKFTNVLKEKHFILCNIQDEEGYQYPSYIELNDIYRHIDEVAEQLKEKK